MDHPRFRQSIEQYDAALARAPLPEIVNRFLQRDAAKSHVAIKVFHEHFVELEGADLRAEPLCILLERRDVVAQIVSLIAANVTGRALDREEDSLGHAPEPLSAAVVKRAILYICLSRRRWQTTLGAKQRVPRIVTEDLFADPQTQLSRLATHLASFDIQLNVADAVDLLQQRKPYAQDADLKARIRHDYATLLEPLRTEGPF